MPIYDFRCQECGEVSEILVRDPAQEVRCSHCGSGKLEKMFSASYVMTSPSRSPGTTCCGRTERCETPPCSSGGGCCHH